MGQNDIHSDWAKLILEVADVENDHLVVDVDIGLLGENTSKGARNVFAEALGELWAGAAHMDEGVVEMEDSWWLGLVGERVGGDAGASVGVDEGLVEIGFFGWTEGGIDLAIGCGLSAAEHEAEEAMKGDEVGTKRVVGVFGVDDFW